MTTTRMQTFGEFLDIMLNEPLAPSFPIFPQQMIVSDVLLKTDDDQRIFEGWGTVEIKDKQGDLIPIEAFAPLMKKFMERGAPILDSHSNRHVGKIIDYKFKDKNGKKGLWLKGEIFDDYSTEDSIWKAIKHGLITGFSLGGRAKPNSQKVECDATSGECYNKIDDIELWEFSVVRRPANPEATITSVNKLAKDGLELELDLLEKKVEQRGNQWCVVHCTGPDAGKAIKCFDTKEEAERMHRAIEANKGLDIEKQDERPPKDWWEKCIGRARSFADDPEAFCGDLWHNGPADKREAFGKMIDYEKMNSLMLDYVTKNNITKLDARAMLEKCTLCREHVVMLKAMGVDEDIALLDLQKKLNTILEEKNKMSVDVKVKPSVPPIAPEAKQGAPPAAAAATTTAPPQDIQVLLEELMKRMAAIEEVVFPKQASQPEAPQLEAKTEELIGQVFAKELKKFFEGVTTAKTERPRETSPTVPEKVDLTKLTFSELNQIRIARDPKLRNLAIRGY